MNRRNLLSRLGAVAGFAVAAPLLRLFPVTANAAPFEFGARCQKFFWPIKTLAEYRRVYGEGPWPDLVLSLAECGEGYVHISVWVAGNQEIHHFGRDCVRDIGRCPREFTAQELSLFTERRKGRCHIGTQDGKPFCGADDRLVPLMMSNPNGGIIDCPDCITKLNRQSCADADHVVRCREPYDYYEVVHRAKTEGKHIYERHCPYRKVWHGDGRLSDKAAQKAWDAREIVYWPDGTVIKATHWNSPAKAV